MLPTFSPYSLLDIWNHLARWTSALPQRHCSDRPCLSLAPISCCKWSLWAFLICTEQECLVIPFLTKHLEVHRFLNWQLKRNTDKSAAELWRGNLRGLHVGVTAPSASGMARSSVKPKRDATCAQTVQRVSRNLNWVLFIVMCSEQQHLCRSDQKLEGEKPTSLLISYSAFLQCHLLASRL